MKEAEEIAKQASAPTALNEHDIEYHRHLVGRINMEAPRLIRERDRLNQEIQDLSGAQVSWSRYLTEKYGLVPPHDTVQDDGSIQRGPRG